MQNRQMPAAVEKHPAPRRDEIAEVGGRFGQPVGDEFHLPPDSGQFSGQPVSDFRHQALRQF